MANGMNIMVCSHKSGPRSLLICLDSICHKTTDIQRMVAPAAYLLFYRRRSSVPLGGPHFQEIIERFDNQSSNGDEDLAGSGEDQRLGADSSHRGSSSALTGVGATRPLGPGSVGGIPMTRNPLNKGSLLSQAMVNPADIDAPPDYCDVITEDDGAPLLQGDAEMNDGIEMDGGLDDEAIDLGPYNDFPANRNTTFSPGNTALLGTWTFQNLETYTSATNPLTHNSETANDIDADERSDIVQHNSSASEGSIEARLQEFNDADVEGGDWEDPSPVPDIDEEAQMRIIDLHKDFLESGNNFGAGGFGNSAVFARVGVSDAQGSDGGDEEEAAEIHVDEGEGVN
jgi:ubiquitin carboxyl-terminal hydrolase 4/11/15